MKHYGIFTEFNNVAQDGEADLDLPIPKELFCLVFIH